LPFTAASDPEAFEATLDAYYDYRGWGRDGLPTPELVEALDLTGTIDDETPLSSEHHTVEPLREEGRDAE